MFAFHTVAGIILAAGGVVVHRGTAAAARGRVDLPRWIAPSAVLGLAVVAIGGFWYVHTRAPDVTEHGASTRLYYLGESFEQLRLTHAEASERRALFVYGGCDTRIGFDPGGCSSPLQLQNVTCPGSEPTAVAIFGGGGGLALRAATALRPIQAGATRQRPRVSFNRGIACTR